MTLDLSSVHAIKLQAFAKIAPVQGKRLASACRLTIKAALYCCSNVEFGFFKVFQGVKRTSLLIGDVCGWSFQTRSHSVKGPQIAQRCDAILKKGLLSEGFACASNTQNGGVAEWLKAHAWKVCIRETVSRVRIPLPPP